MATTEIGARAALRGYRNQFLYTLHRLLDSSSDESLSPEQYEDLTVFAASEPKEIVQVKDKKDNLTLSDAQSFFDRSIGFLREGKTARFVLVSFGALGNDFLGFSENRDASKLHEKLVQNGHDAALASSFLERLEIKKVDEATVREEVSNFISQTTAALDPAIAFDLLLFWVYRTAENRETLTRPRLIQKVSAIGEFISGRHSFMKEFGKTVIPIIATSLEQGDGRLKEQFYAGSSAKYSHILAGLDVVRHSKLEDLDQCFRESNIVILHGASGQGKSALAYRYIRERFLDSYSFEIPSILDKAHVYKLAQTIKTLAKPFDEPFLIMVDVQPGNLEWVELCATIIEVPFCRVLVCIREEDLNRSTSLDEFTKPAELRLDFDESEAQEIYLRLEEKEAIHRFLNFEDAWSQFGGKGPLLEFVFYLNQGQSLRNRLQNQISRIREESRSSNDPDQVTLLKLVANAGAYDSRLNLSKTVQHLQLFDAKQTIEWFQNEYLLRPSPDGKYLETLHPVRAKLMAEILCDEVFDSQEKNLEACFDLIEEEDVGTFLLHFFYNYGCPETLWAKMLAFQPKDWKTCQAIFASLVWLGVRQYIADNKQQIEQLKAESGVGFQLFIMMQVADGVDFSVLGKPLGEERFGRVQSIIRLFSDKKHFYDFAVDWLKAARLPERVNLTSAEEITAFGKTLFWLGQLKVEKDFIPSVFEYFTDIDDTLIDAETMSDLLLGLHSFNSMSRSAAEEFFPAFKTKFQIEHKAPVIEDDGATVRVHFFFTPDGQSEDEQGNMFHSKTMKLLRIVRKAFSNRQFYAAQGYGHHYKLIPFLHDATYKDMPAKNLPLPWLTDAYGIYLNLLAWGDRPDNWKELATNLFQFQKTIARRMDDLMHQLVHSFKSGKNLKLDLFSKDELDEDPDDRYEKLPKEAVDKWGFLNEFPNKNEKGKIDFHKTPLIHLAAPEIHQAFKTVKDFRFTIKTFFNQAEKVKTLKEVGWKWTNQQWEQSKEKRAELGYDDHLMHLTCYHLHTAAQQFMDFYRSMSHFFQKHSTVNFFEAEAMKTVENLSSLFWVWNQYAQKNQLVKNIDIEKSVLRKERELLAGIESLLSRKLKELAKQGIVKDFELITVENHKLPEIIVVYVVDWFQAFAAATLVQTALRECLYPAPIGSFKWWVLERNIEQFQVVPLFEDISPNKSCFVFKIYRLLEDTEREIDALNFSIIPDTLIQDLEIQVGAALYPSLQSPENFNAKIQLIGVYLHFLSQLRTLFGKGEVGDTIIGVEVMKALIKIKSLQQEVGDLTDEMLKDLNAELISSEPFIPDFDVAEKIGVIWNAIFEMNQISEELALQESVNPNTFDLIESWDEKLDIVRDLATQVYCSWSSILLNRINNATQAG